MTYRCATRALLPMFCIWGGFACSPGVQVTLPDGCPDCQPLNDDVEAGLLTAFLSSTSPRIVRNDPDMRSAELTASASREATFLWQVDDAKSILDVCVQSGDDCVSLIAASENQQSALRSVLRVRDVVGDPGPGGSLVRVSVTITADAQTDEPQSITRNIELLVQRPETELEVSFKSFASRVNPNGELELTAIIRGGSPFVFDDASEEDNPCQLDLSSLDPKISRFTTPDALPHYCVVWVVDEREVEEASGALEVLPLETNNEGETISVARFAAAPTTGGVVFGIEVSDREAKSSTSAVSVSVESERALGFAEASSSSTQVAPGKSVTLTAAAVGGEPPYLFTFRITGDDPKGSLSGEVEDGASELTLPLCTPQGDEGSCVRVATYTASGIFSGSELILVRIEDAVGAVATTTIPITVLSRAGLSLEAFAASSAVNPSETTSITTEITGGTAPYTVCYRLTAGSDGQLQSKADDCTAASPLLDDFVLCTCGVGNIETSETIVESVVRTYQAASTSGAANVAVRAVDAVGDAASAVVSLEISGAVGPFCGDGVVNGIEECEPGVAPCGGTSQCVNCQCELSASCGNGVLNDGEACDDGGNSEACDADCTLPVCGDGFVNSVAGEQCDDGPQNGTGENRCLSDCSDIQHCGDGVVNGTESCELNAQSCGEVEVCTDCQCAAAPFCGDGEVDSGEECDDGNDINTDACLNSCVMATCGDGFVRTGMEECDDGESNGAGDEFCLADCSGIQICGDGEANGTEACDDGESNGTGNEFCLADCSGTQNCGDGIANGTEECDDGDTTDNNDCTNECSNPFCGDGIVWDQGDGTEQCDDGNNDDGDGCTVNCTIEPICGNGIVETGEQCDEGALNGTGNGRCLSDCGGVQSCGDTVVNGTEECEVGILCSDQSETCSNCMCQPN